MYVLFLFIIIIFLVNSFYLSTVVEINSCCCCFFLPQSKLLENHILHHSGTYLGPPYMAVPPGGYLLYIGLSRVNSPVGFPYFSGWLLFGIINYISGITNINHKGLQRTTNEYAQNVGL